MILISNKLNPLPLYNSIPKVLSVSTRSDIVPSPLLNQSTIFTLSSYRQKPIHPEAATYVAGIERRQRFAVVLLSWARNGFAYAQCITR